jgi:hypothetical protein
VSDTSQGPGWWQASDGKWYPPEQAPGYQASGGGGAPGTLDVGAAITYGWNKFVQYIGQIIVIILIIVAVQVVFNFLSRVISGSINSVIVALSVSFALSIIGWIISLVLQAGLIRVGLAVTDGREPEPGMLFQTDNIGPFIVASILVGLLTFVGFFVFCIGALVVALFMVFYGFYVIDKSAQPVDSITSSFNLVKDNLGSVFLLALLAVVINFCTCGLGAGVTQIAIAYAYRTLNGQPVAP